MQRVYAECKRLGFVVSVRAIVFGSCYVASCTRAVILIDSTHNIFLRLHACTLRVSSSSLICVYVKGRRKTAIKGDRKDGRARRE